VLARRDIDIIVELMGGYEPARTVILEALKSGKNVITANKAVLAKHWDEIFTTARKYSRLVYFEASVCGAIPVIQVLNDGLAANRIEKISGILNGTTNYILSEMTRENINFSTALARAQRSGFAEADPSFDIEGIDTANKLAILSSLAWGAWVKLPDIRTRGIEEVSSDDVYFAKKFGYVIKLLGTAVSHGDGLELSVEPCLIPSKHTFANVEKEYNAILVHGDAAGDIMLYGKGAGQMAAASAVVSDIISLSREVANGTAGRYLILPSIRQKPRKSSTTRNAKARITCGSLLLTNPGYSRRYPAYSEIRGFHSERIPGRAHSQTPPRRAYNNADPPHHSRGRLKGAQAYRFARHHQGQERQVQDRKLKKFPVYVNHGLNCG